MWPPMTAVIHFGIHLLEALFVAGSIGSALVIVLSGIEDLHVIFEKDEPAAGGASE